MQPDPASPRAPAPPPGSPPPANLPPAVSSTPPTPVLPEPASASSPTLSPPSALPELDTGAPAPAMPAPAMVEIVKPTLPAPPQTASSPGESSSEAAMYESPSPPSSASSGPEYAPPPQGYGSIARRRRSPQAGEDGAGGSTVVSLQNDAALGNISPIQATRVVHRRDANIVGVAGGDLPYSDMPDEQNGGSHGVGWQGSSYVPVLADETTALMRDVPLDSRSLSGSELLSRSRADLERARLASTREFNRRETREGMKDRYILGCSVLVMTSVVFVIVVSGLTTILANRNYPQLEVYSDWPNGGIIPLKYGCHAPDGPVSIPLHWRNVPRQATNLAVLFAHPGAIIEQGFDPVHWFITDIPLSPEKDGSLPANASLNADLMPPGSKQHANSGSEKGTYWPPCISNGTSFFVVHVYAIDASPVIEDFRDAREIINRFVGVPVARITGLYGKPKKLVIPEKKKNKGKDPHKGEDISVASVHH